MDMKSYLIGKKNGGMNWSEIDYDETPSAIIDAFEYAKQIKENWNPNRTSYNSYFANNNALFLIPLISVSKATNCNSMFMHCSSLAALRPLNTQSCTNFGYMFYSCKNLKTIPAIDTPKGVTFSYMFYDCSSLTTIPKLDMSDANTVMSMFEGCSSLTNLGGFLNLGKSYSTTVSANYGYCRLMLSSSTKITHKSLMNVIDNLYDIKTKGCKTQQLTLGSNNLKKLTAEEIAIATDKGWTVS